MSKVSEAMSALFFCALAAMPIGAVAEIKYESPEAQEYIQKVSGHLKSGVLKEASAREIFKDYQNNEVAADAKYKGKFVFVDGVVNTVSKDMFGNIIIKISTQNMFAPVDGVMAKTVTVITGMETKKSSVSLKKMPSEEAASLVQKGSKVHMICVGNGMILASPQLKTCDTLSR